MADFDNKIYCVNDFHRYSVNYNGRKYLLNNDFCRFHRIFAAKCAACHKSITPISETGETIRVVSMEKDFHVDCYVCEV